MEIETVTNLISSVGFPIFVAVWLLWKGEQQNRNVVEALTELKHAVIILTGRCEDE